MMKVLTEQEVNSPDFDHPPCPLSAKIIICSTPRSGSYLLCRAMIHHGIGVPHEYFNGINASSISARLCSQQIDSSHLAVDGEERREYISTLLKHRTVNGIFAAKIQGGQFAQYFKDSSRIELFKDAHFIYLYRENLLDQAISFHIALLTGRWGPDNTISTRPSAQPNFFDAALLDDRLRTIAVQDMEWRLFFARNAITPLFLSYESIKDDIAGTLRNIVAHSQLVLPLKDFTYIEPKGIEFRDPDAPPRSEVKARFLEKATDIVKD